MTIQQILAGPQSDRPNRAGYPMTEAEARHVLAQMESQMSKRQRGRVARMTADAGIGNLSDEARALYRAYAEAYGA